jgi:hypothetical protein
VHSDDEERTLGSGHVLMDGFFPPDGSLSHDAHHMLTWNVADYKSDYIAPNEPMCPVLTFIWGESLQSEEYKKRVSDPARAELTKRFESHVGKFSWDTALECLATSRCNDLALPEGVDEELFDKVFQEVEAEEGISLAYSGAWYSKIAMQPLANDIISRVDKVTEGVSWATKLAVTMGACRRLCFRLMAFSHELHVWWLIRPRLDPDAAPGCVAWRQVGPDVDPVCRHGCH